MGQIEYTIPDRLSYSQIQINYPEKKIMDFADFCVFLSWGVWTGDNPYSDRKSFSDLLNIVYELTSLRFIADSDDKRSSVYSRT